MPIFGLRPASNIPQTDHDAGQKVSCYFLTARNALETCPHADSAGPDAVFSENKSKHLCTEWHQNQGMR